MIPSSLPCPFLLKCSRFGCPRLVMARVENYRRRRDGSAKIDYLCAYHYRRMPTTKVFEAVTIILYGLSHLRDVCDRAVGIEADFLGRFWTVWKDREGDHGREIPFTPLIKRDAVLAVVNEALGYLSSGKGPRHTERVLRNLVESLTGGK